ncbi:hypothetical protein BOTBODRAFT_53229 [Botryobasidium botryosum FD-172 SS1]|uniref:Uncharacterized protein n=1 Tax=Botryobasidium botryosum (strain FD-172 SS1) TaxID=930990 RepID=A0A067N0J9_BOTB1|nr:hypothetical protein BOTBODRAFT_53229 [Botryobasidium botryosum FD-172 SS1]
MATDCKPRSKRSWGTMNAEYSLAAELNDKLGVLAQTKLGKLYTISADTDSQFSKMRDALWGQKDHADHKRYFDLDDASDAKELLKMSQYSSFDVLPCEEPADDEDVGKAGTSAPGDGHPSVFRCADIDDIDDPPCDTYLVKSRKILCVRDIPILKHSFSCVLVRDEYRLAMKYLRGRVMVNPAGAVTIGGQAGIGKSIFIYYALIHRITSGLPVALQYTPESVLLFLKSGTYCIPANTNPANDTIQQLPRGIWALVDSDQLVDEPAPVLRGISPFFTIQAASGSTSQTAWHKYKDGQVWNMRPWSWDEIIAAAAFQRRSVSADGLRFAYDLFGPCARTCYKLADDRSAIEAHDREIRKFIKWCRDEPLGRIISRTTLSPAVTSQAEHLFIATPSSHRAVISYDVASKYIGRLMIERWALCRPEKLTKMSLFCPQGSAACCLFEHRVNGILSSGSPVPLRPIHITRDERERVYIYDTSRIDPRVKATPWTITPRIITRRDIKNSPRSTLANTEYYVPQIENQATYSSFVQQDGVLYVFHLTLGGTYNISKKGLEQLKACAGVSTPFSVVLITPTGTKVRGTVPEMWKDRVNMFMAQLDEHGGKSRS